MFKKIELWVLYLALLLNIPVMIGFGILVRQELVGTSLGGLSKIALFLAEIPVNLKNGIIENKNVPGRGFIDNRFPSLSGFIGTKNSKESYLLLSRYDGDLEEGIVELVDLTNFKTLHTWNPDIDKFSESYLKTNNSKNFIGGRRNARYVLKHPILQKDGLVFKHTGPLMKIDECANLIFQNNHDSFHHSIEKDIEGNIWVPSYIYPQSLPIEKVGRNTMEEGGFYDDGIVKLSPYGKILFERSVSQIFIDNGLEYLLFSVGNKGFNADPIHLNDIQPVDFDGEYWEKGDIFLSLKHQSMVLLYRPKTNKIIWKGVGPFFHQHDVDILNGHTIAVFNNNSKDFENQDVVEGNNEIVIYDFKLDEYSSYLNDSLIKNDVKTKSNGLFEILTNGDLFVEEHNYGRVLYFDRDGSLKWSYHNVADDGKTFLLGWSRILHKEEDISIVNDFLKSRGNCND